MKKYIFLVFIFAIIGFFTLPSCMPDPTPTPTVIQTDSSWWMVDTQRFISYSNYVTGTQSHTILSGAAISGNNQFSITFNLTYIPAQGSYLLDCSNTSASSACMEITYNGIRYRANQSPASYLHADSANQRAVLNLNATRFYSTLSPNDSIQVLGVFHQP